MKVYIASSWKNEHAVWMLAGLLRQRGHEVLSFVENCGREEHNAKGKRMDFDKWVWSDEGAEKFVYDFGGAVNSDLVVYIGPSGTDAWAEVGAAYARGAGRIFGLWAKGEPAGLMRRMVEWHKSVAELLEAVDEMTDGGV